MTASKLLSRKRPRLVPIIDSVVHKQIDAPEGTYWQLFREYLAYDSRRSTVEELRPPGLSDLVSTLRLLDVGLWITGSQGRIAQALRAGRSSNL